LDSGSELVFFAHPAARHECDGDLDIPINAAIGHIAIRETVIRASKSYALNGFVKDGKLRKRPRIEKEVLARIIEDDP
jgi:hypothetical protein